LAPGAVGWHSVTDIFTPDRFERYELKAGAGWMVAGMPNFPGVYALKRSAGYLLRARVERFDISLQPLVARLRNGLASLGLDLLTPPGPECASGIVAFEHPRADAIGRALDEERVIVWAGDGRVRASLHLYNDEDDVRRYLDVLKSILEAERV
jgi:selenocysteine lyase/cysteine desulfurase